VFVKKKRKRIKNLPFNYQNQEFNVLENQKFRIWKNTISIVYVKCYN